MINSILPHKFDNQYHNYTIVNDNDYIFHFKGNSLLLEINGDEYKFPVKKELYGEANVTVASFLFSFNDKPCFLVWDIPQITNRYTYKEINLFRKFKQREIAWLSMVAFQLMNWILSNKYCGKCGSKTEEKRDERAIICSGCNTIVYPKISPAIIVAIVCNDKILLAHNSNFANNWYSLVAGYADIGESLEETVIREVKEEVGLDVKNIRYCKSQPWPYSGSLMIGFVAEADELQPIHVDNIEINEAAWFTRENLPNHPPNISISGEMIELFEKGKL